MISSTAIAVEKAVPLSAAAPRGAHARVAITNHAARFEGKAALHRPQKLGRFLRRGLLSPRMSMTGVAGPAQAATAEAVTSELNAPATENSSAGNEQAMIEEIETVMCDDPKDETCVKPLNIVFVTSEVAPWSKTGGLGDVCGSLPKVLGKRGHRTMVIAPRYGLYPDAIDTGVRITVHCFGGSHEVGFFHCFRDNVDWIFIDHPGAYLRMGTPYGDANGPFGDNHFRFTLMCLAALEAPLQVPIAGIPYGQDVVFIANDWHASLVPVYLAAKYRPYGVFLGARSIMCVHNLYHQGVFPPGRFSQLNLPGNWYSCLEYQYPVWARKGAYEEEGRSINHLKGGLTTADRVLTVSPGYAWEMATSEGGWGLDTILRNRSYHTNGILNGIDYNDWDPATDKLIPANYSHEDLAGKAACKAALQKELGLPERPDVPMITFIGRLDYQKGADLLAGAMPWLMSQDVQLVMLGTGEGQLEDMLRWAESAHRDKARGWVGFSVPMSHRMIAGADILLMPSRFEPCGLNQLYAMRYGTIPVAHATGGLRDTVIDYNPEKDTGTGWTFSPAGVDGVKHGLGLALYTYRNHKDAWARIQQRGMTQDFSWDKAAQQYEQVFQWAQVDLPYSG
eukprot:jgi/Mesvir1/22628/Mv14066-RA.1